MGSLLFLRWIYIGGAFVKLFFVMIYTPTLVELKRPFILLNGEIKSKNAFREI